LILQNGDKIKVSYKERKAVHTNEYCVVDVFPTKNFIVVTNGIYNNTIDKLLIRQGKVKIELLKRKGRSMKNACNT
jgi:hypothetical protein